MVRVAIGLLCMQRVLCESALMQTQTQSDHILDALHSGSNRVKKMQDNTQAMESQYKALLQNIVDSGSLTDPKTGTPWLPGQKFLDTVSKQFSDLVDELKFEKDTNQGLLNNSHEELNKTNDDMEGGIRKITHGAKNDTHGSWGVMIDARSTHITCRGVEDDNIEDMEKKCKAFDVLSTKCHDHQDWYSQYDDANIEDVDGQENTLKALVDQAEECRAAVAVVDQKSVECDTAQGTYKSKYCTYSQRLSTICNTHSKDYQARMKDLEQTNRSIRELEVEQKTIFRMVLRVQCYIEKLTNAKVDNMPNQTDIQDCIGLDPDDSDLTIRYDVPEAPLECWQNAELSTEIDTHPENAQRSKPTYPTQCSECGENCGCETDYEPGQGDWYATEIDTTALNNHSKVQPDTACGN